MNEYRYRIGEMAGLDVSLASTIFSGIITDAVCASLSRSDFVEPLVTQPSRLDHVQGTAWDKGADANAGASICPAHIVVFPIGHPVTTITSESPNDDRNQTEKR